MCGAVLKSFPKSLWSYHVSGKVCGYVFPNLLRKRNLTAFSLIPEYMYSQSNATLNSYQFKAYWCLCIWKTNSKLHFAHLQHKGDISDLRNAFQSKCKFTFGFSTGFDTISMARTTTSLIIGENISFLLKILLRSILIAISKGEYK